MRAEGTAGTLMVLQPEDRSERSSGWVVRAQVALRDLRRKPNAIRVIDVLGDGRTALMLCVPREAPLIFCNQPGQPFALEAFGTATPVRQRCSRHQPAQIKPWIWMLMASRNSSSGAPAMRGC